MQSSLSGSSSAIVPGLALSTSGARAGGFVHHFRATPGFVHSLQFRHLTALTARSILSYTPATFSASAALALRCSAVVSGSPRSAPAGEGAACAADASGGRPDWRRADREAKATCTRSAFRLRKPCPIDNTRDPPRTATCLLHAHSFTRSLPPHARARRARADAHMRSARTPYRLCDRARLIS